MSLKKNLGFANFYPKRTMKTTKREDAKLPEDMFADNVDFLGEKEERKLRFARNRGRKDNRFMD